MIDTKYLDYYEKTLMDGLIKVCQGAGVLKGSELLSSADIDAKWEEYIKPYIEDAVGNFNQYPEAALGFAAFLGMAVAHNWDADWAAHKDDPYQSYYGSRGWDDLDEHTMWELLRLTKDYGKQLSDALDSCALATLGLIRHEQIEAETELGFYVLSRSYTVMYKLGAALELERLGYKKVPVDKIV